MAAGSKTRNMIESLVKDRSFKWLLGKRNSFSDEFEQMEASPSAGRNWITELSPLANLVVRRCSKILAIAAADLQENFNSEVSELLKHHSSYARNFLEYCCFKAISYSIQNTGHLTDKKFRRLTYDMMLAWESPAATSQPPATVDEELSVGLEAFSRITPAIPIIADVIICENLFEILTVSTEGRLQFPLYDKYLSGLERATGKLKNYTESSLLSASRSLRNERILEVDGTVTTQPVLEHVGVSTWPGRLVLTDHALYFEAIRVVSYDKPKLYDLSEDLKQLVKPDMTGPWGTRLFDKAVSYKSISLSEPVVFEFPELKGHSRRDYWLAIIREVLYVHKFIARFKVTGCEKDEALAKALLGILRVQVLQDVCSSTSLRFDSLLLFNLLDQIPGGDMILEMLAKQSDRTRIGKDGDGMYSVSSLTMVSSLSFLHGTSHPQGSEVSIMEMSDLAKVVKESKSSYRKLLQAQETVDGAKVDGIDTNLAVMKELLCPAIKIGNWIHSLLIWDDPLFSTLFCVFFAFIIWRGWLRYALSMALFFFAMCIALTRLTQQGHAITPLNVIAPPPSNTMEQLLAVQTAISHVEQFVQDGNVFLLKLRALLLAVFPQASEKVVMVLLAAAAAVAALPFKWMVVFMFIEIFTRYSPLRRASTERLSRRLKEWWYSIPAAPVVLEREKEDKKKK